MLADNGAFLLHAPPFLLIIYVQTQREFDWFFHRDLMHWQRRWHLPKPSWDVACGATSCLSLHSPSFVLRYMPRPYQTLRRSLHLHSPHLFLSQSVRYSQGLWPLHFSILRSLWNFEDYWLKISPKTEIQCVLHVLHRLHWRTRTSGSSHLSSIGVSWCSLLASGVRKDSQCALFAYHAPRMPFEI